MKKLQKLMLVGIIIIVVVFIFARVWQKNQTVSPPTETTTQIIFPTGGENLIKGQTYTLHWSGGPDSIQIFLIDTSLKSAGVSVSISDRIYNLKNSGAYDYPIPVNLKDGTYEFQIGNSTSNTFRIVSSN